MGQNMKHEIWKDIKGYEGLYKVSSMGRIKRLKGYRCLKERYMSQYKDKYGYLRIGLTKNNICVTNIVHRLVAVAFLPNPENKRTVNHKDGDIRNNTVENLEWATDSEQHIHAYRVLGRKGHWTGKHGKDNPHSRRVVQFSLEGELIAEYAGQSEASRATGISQGYISSCCNGKAKSAGGFIWEYTEKE